jgi:hypothetical protein
MILITDTDADTYEAFERELKKVGERLDVDPDRVALIDYPDWYQPTIDTLEKPDEEESQSGFRFEFRGYQRSYQKRENVRSGVKSLSDPVEVRFKLTEGRAEKKIKRWTQYGSKSVCLFGELRLESERGGPKYSGPFTSHGRPKTIAKHFNEAMEKAAKRIRYQSRKPPSK